MSIKKAYCYEDIERKNFKTLDFNGKWEAHIGKPECSGSWSAHGLSGHGKTSYEMQLAKYLAGFGRVHINTLEEGMRLSFKNALIRHNMKEVKSKFSFQSETYDQLVERLMRKRQPKMIMIDSTQYFFRKMRLNHYFDLLEMFPTTLFVFFGHARGNHPKGDLADDIRFHSDVKLHIKDFQAIVQTSRFGGGEPYIIWEKGYNERQLVLT